ncbi:hypothetical protein BJY00DRAFT_58946 [Aspergillus carlsbadensis]|nr:hypothetical protein BJY00DRAFT_58946 [Aspergillus carlsbadensis]
MTSSGTASSSTGDRKGLVTLKLPRKLGVQRTVPRPVQSSTNEKTKSAHTFQAQTGSMANRDNEPRTTGSSDNSSLLQRPTKTGNASMGNKKARSIVDPGEPPARKKARLVAPSPSNDTPAASSATTSKSSQHPTQIAEPHVSAKPQLAPKPRSKISGSQLFQAPTTETNDTGTSRLHPPTPDASGQTLGGILQQLSGCEAEKLKRLQNEIDALQDETKGLQDKLKALQDQKNANIKRISGLKQQVAEARADSDTARMFLQRPDMLLQVNSSKLSSWIRSVNIPGSQQGFSSQGEKR